MSSIQMYYSPLLFELLNFSYASLWLLKSPAPEQLLPSNKLSEPQINFRSNLIPKLLAYEKKKILISPNQVNP